jgi:multidrug transporter EmrE-like cation transporter
MGILFVHPAATRLRLRRSKEHTYMQHIVARSRSIVKRIAAAAATIGFSLLPVAAAAQTSLNVGLSYGTYTGLGTADVRVTIAKIINVAMGLLGIIAVVIVLWGGFMWMTAGGAEDRVKDAKKMLFAGVIGLAIVLMAYAIANFVVGSLVTATTG